jgi:flagellar biogenesis protein FliO
MTSEVWQLPSSSLWLRACRCWKRMAGLARRAPHRLRLCESLALGERRFVAVIEFDQSRFLVGGTPASLVLLSKLPDRASSGAEGQVGTIPCANQGDGL